VSLRKFLVALFGLCLSSASGVHAAPPPLEAYGNLPAIENISLSPSGQFIASIGNVQDKRYIQVRTLSGDVRMAVPVPTGKIKIRDIVWADDNHVLILASATYTSYDLDRGETGFIFSLDLNARSATTLFSHDPRFADAGYQLLATHVIDSKPYAFLSHVPKEGVAVGSLVQSDSNAQYRRDWPDLWRIDLTTNTIERAARGSPNIDSWAVSPDGSVAAVSNFDTRTSTWMLYHGSTELMKRSSARLLTEVSGLGRTPGSVLVFDRSGAVDRWTEVAADGSTQTLWPGENVTGELRSETTGLLIGAVIDNAAFKFFDPAKQARIEAATKPFHGRITLNSATDAVDEVVLHTEGEGDSGTYYLVNLKSHRADIIDNDYPDVPPDQVGEVRRIAYPAADGTALDGVLTLPPGRAPKDLPIVVLPHGGPIGEYDAPNFDWIAQAFASRGYAVFQPNYRGSGGHGAAFQQAGYGEYGRAMLSDISDGLKFLVGQNIADPRRACIVGFSYGGYAALAGVTVQQGLYRCAVSGSGLSDLPKMLQWEVTRQGLGSPDVKYLKEAMGVTVDGAPSLESISPARLANRADAPILLIHGTDDSVVPIEQSQEMVRVLQAAHKPVEFLYTKDEDHWLSRSATRLATLKAAVAFVQKYNPAD
jgi:dipeptidyl aminopeptidase/acylaminoacyl peptidase